MNDKTKELINGIGALVEMAAAMRDMLLRNGFTREEAFAVSKDVIVNAFIVAQQNGKGE